MYLVPTSISYNFVLSMFKIEENLKNITETRYCFVLSSDSKKILKIVFYQFLTFDLL